MIRRGLLKGLVGAVAAGSSLRNPRVVEAAPINSAPPTPLGPPSSFGLLRAEPDSEWVAERTKDRLFNRVICATDDRKRSRVALRNAMGGHPHVMTMRSNSDYFRALASYRKIAAEDAAEHSVLEQVYERIFGKPMRDPKEELDVRPFL